MIWISFFELYPYLGGEWVLLEVVVLECDLRGDSLGGVHDEQLLEEHEGLAVRLDPVTVHVLHERAVHVAETSRLHTVNLQFGKWVGLTLI